MAADERALRVLRVCHSAVVGPWRERERLLVAGGVDLVLVVPRRWDEGGADVAADAVEPFVRRVGTVGRHPYRFAYDPVGLWRALRSADGWDLLDLHEEPASLAAAEVRAVARLARRRAPLLLYTAQNLVKRYPPPFRWFERSALRAAAAVYPCSEGPAAVARAKGARGLVRVLGLGVDLDAFAPGPPRPVGGPLAVGYVGRLEPHKGVHVLLEALAGVPGATLEVVGGGPAEGELRTRAEALGVAGRTRFLGHQPAAALASAYRAVDVVAVPSLPTPAWEEQFGRVAVEAMASGTPVVASASGALPEVVGDGGLLVPPGDAPALATALVEVAADDEAARAARRRRARAAAARFGWPAIADQHLALYREVAAGTGAPGPGVRVRVGVNAQLLESGASYRNAGITTVLREQLRLLPAALGAGAELVAFGHDPTLAALVTGAGGGAAARVVPTRRPGRPSERIAWEQLALPVLARRERLDVLLQPTPIVTEALRTPQVACVHDVAFLRHDHLHTPGRRRYLTAMLRRAASKAAVLAAVSRFTADELVELLGVPPDRIALVPNGIDHARFAPAPQPGDAALVAAVDPVLATAPYLLHVGTLEPRKNLERLVAAFAAARPALEEAAPGLRLVLAGGTGWYAEPILQAVADAGLADRVLLTGHVSVDALAPLYRGAWAVAYPSLYEGFGLPAAEALACGAPLLASTAAAIVEVVGEAAVVRAPDDVEALADGLRALTDDVTRAALRQAGPARAAGCTWEASTAALAAALRRAAA